MIAADAPTGHFGATNEVTLIGVIYAVAVLTLALAMAAAVLLGRRVGNLAVPILASVNVIVFIPALAYDMRIAGAIILWNLVLLAEVVFASETRGSRLVGHSERAAGPWLARHGDAARHLVLVALFSTIVVGGFELTRSWVADLTCVVLDLAAILVTAPFMWEELRKRRALAVLLSLAVASGIYIAETVGGALLALALYQCVVLLMLLARGPVFSDLMQSFLTRPALLILSTFAGMASIGAMLLSFPAAVQGMRLSFIDALFTATSASCITGLVVVDTGTTFTTFGLIVILVLIQLGGLGIMVLSTFATVLLGGRLGLRSEHALEEMLDLTTPRAAYSLARFIVVSTLAIEAIGAGLLTWAFYNRGMELGTAAWSGVFHAVSSFCHAGFALWSDSLMGFSQDGLVLGVHMTLVALGSLGFAALAGIWMRMRGTQRRLSLETRVVLWISVILWVGGTVGYALLEWEASLQGLSSGWKWVNALFQSVSMRSGGFNSVDFAVIEPATVAMMMMWMFVGAAPGSTGGGIKVTTMAVMLAAIPALLRNQPRATLLRRAIPLEIVYRAATIVTVAGLALGLGLIVLLATHRLRFDWMAFEVVSALGTVGLSIGATSHLTAVGKWVIIVLMFIGRVGPTSLALAVGASRKGHVRFPEARLMVG